MKTRREFVQDIAAVSASLLVNAKARADGVNSPPSTARPNIVMILADDMGFSDIGCYGSEIATPHLDRLAAGGIRFSQFYNSPRCCPSRAALLTGLYSHQAGFGMMADDYGRYSAPAYRGDLSPDCVTIAEALRAGGYRTAMTGKWHLTPVRDVDHHNWPTHRGFDHFYGTIAGASSYFHPATLVEDDRPVEPGYPYYYTDAIGDHAAGYVADFAKQQNPFFLYVAFTAPHWPLHAHEADIAKYADRYRTGWDELRRRRHARQLEMGLLQEKWPLTPRDARVPPWERASLKDWEARRMAVYAAMIETLDRNVGKVITQLDQLSMLDNTLILFMSDNGGNFEETSAPSGPRPIYMPATAHDGKPVVAGNNPEIMPGAEQTYQSIGIPWGNCANTPFRLYKHYAHEGGISTPFIAHWPRGIQSQEKICNHLGHETDVMATCLDIAGVPYPAKAPSGATPPALAGYSLRPIFETGTRPDRGPVFWEHEGNAAMRDGKWKLVSRFPDSWELYDMDADRTELHDLADQQPERTQDMIASWKEWAARVGVQPWPLPETPAGERSGAMTSPPYLLHDR